MMIALMISHFYASRCNTAIRFSTRKYLPIRRRRRNAHHIIEDRYIYARTSVSAVRHGSRRHALFRVALIVATIRADDISLRQHAYAFSISSTEATLAFQDEATDGKRRRLDYALYAR